MGHRNPKSGQGDGAGFGRLRAAENQRAEFHGELSRRHKSNVYIDQVREYAGICVVFYRIDCVTFEEARVAAFKSITRIRAGAAGYELVNDMVVNVSKED